MSTVAVRWASWYGDDTLELGFPDSWKIQLCPPRGGDDIGEEGIRRALAQSIGLRPIRELARGKKDAVVVIDDLTRGTPAGRLVPPLLEELAAGGIPREKVVVLVGLGAHRAFTRQDFIRKLGVELVDSLDLRNHDPYENLTPVGVSQGGTPVQLNADFMQANLKISVGCIVPHGLAGFGGGAKMVLPGVASLDTIDSNHRPTDASGRPRTSGVGSEMVDLSWARRDMEDIARLAGLDCIVNVVFTPEKGVAGLFVGEVVAAHRQGVEFAKKAYGTPHPGEVDIAICVAYPEDTELIQSGKGLYVLETSRKPAVKEGGTVVLATAASEGIGFHHQVNRRNAAAPADSRRNGFNKRGRSIVFSPNVTEPEFYRLYGDEVELFREWGGLIRRLAQLHGSQPRVAIFPCGSMQVMEG